MTIRSKQLLSVKSVTWIKSNLLLWIAFYCSISFSEGSSDTIIIHLDQVTTVISNETTTTTIENYNIVQQQQDTDEQLLLFGNDSIKSYNLYCDIGGNLKDDVVIESNHNNNNIQDKAFHDGVTVKKTFKKQQVERLITHKDVGNHANDNSDEFVCRLYLAESTIPHAGLGVFSGIPYAEKDTLPLTGDIIIPLAHLEDVTLISK